MGLLDDAIREHLDLKRRRGADPSEVARAEQEALGPVRREPAATEPTGEHEAEPHADDATRVLAPEDRHEPPHGDPAQQELGGAAATHEPGEATEPEAGHADRAGGGEDARPAAEGRTGAHPEPTGPARSSAEPEPESQRTPEPAAKPEQPDDPRHSDIVHQPTTEFRPEDHPDHPDHDHKDRGPDEDVLEETPDFLQETPEHDRLWFEQRPPRDFDFDG